jgi:hypothetical protein
LSSSFGLTAFVSPVVKEKTLNKIEALEKNTVITLDNEENGRSYLKYAAIFVLGLGLTASVSYTVYQNKLLPKLY